MPIYLPPWQRSCDCCCPVHHWHVPAQPNGAWGWENAGEIVSRSEFYQASAIIEHLLRTAAHVLANTRT